MAQAPDIATLIQQRLSGTQLPQDNSIKSQLSRGAKAAQDILLGPVTPEQMQQKRQVDMQEIGKQIQAVQLMQREKEFEQKKVERGVSKLFEIAKELKDPKDFLLTAAKRNPAIAKIFEGVDINKLEFSDQNKIRTLEGLQVDSIQKLHEKPEDILKAANETKLQNRKKAEPAGARNRVFDAAFDAEMANSGDRVKASEAGQGAVRRFDEGLAKTRGKGRVVGTEEGEQSISGIKQPRLESQSTAVARGAQTGTLQVQSSPEYLQAKEDIAKSQALGGLKGRPLGDAVAVKGAAMLQSIRIVKEIKTQFTPQERANFVGFLKFSFNKVAQLEREDPKFARFLTLLNRAKGAAFGEGGKQLTPFEAGVVFGYVPTGDELVPVNFEAKLDGVLRETPQLYNDLIGLSKTPRGELTPLQVPPPQGKGDGTLSNKAKGVASKFNLE